MRSQQQKRAIDFDRELSTLICRAEGYGCKDQTHLEAHRSQWHKVEDALEQIRPFVRAMMCDADRVK